MNESLTVVLPVYNAEATLRSSVERVLEVASELTPRFGVLVVDDGSIDDSFDIANELAAKYPQVRVLRQAQRRGLGPTLNRVRRGLRSEVVMVHDGVSEINAEQLRALWDQRTGHSRMRDASMSDLLRPAQNQAAMAAAHKRLMSFQLINVDRAAKPADEAAPPAPHTQPARGIGGIPTLPRPNFMGALSDFASGE